MGNHSRKGKRFNDGLRRQLSYALTMGRTVEAHKIVYSGGASENNRSEGYRAMNIALKGAGLWVPELDPVPIISSETITSARPAVISDEALPNLTEA